MLENAGPQMARQRIEPRSLEAASTKLLDEVVRIRETGAGLELYYPYLRHLGMAFGTLLTGGAFVGFAWLFREAGGEGVMSSLFIGLFTLVGILIFVWGLYLPGNALRVTAGRQGLSAVRGVFGLRFARHVAAEEITGIEKSIGMQSRQGKRTHAYYRIQVYTRDGRRLTAGSGIPGASSVDAIIRRIRQALDLSQGNEVSGTRTGGITL